MPKQVYDELTSPDSYWLVKNNVEKLKKEKYLKIISLENNYQTMKEYNNMLKGIWTKPIGKGEAATLSLAIQRE